MPTPANVTTLPLAWPWLSTLDEQRRSPFVETQCTMTYRTKTTTMMMIDVADGDDVNDGADESAFGNNDDHQDEDDDHELR